MTVEQMTIALLVLGLVPLYISRSAVRGKRSQVYWQIHATFWRLTIHSSRPGRKTWKLTVPLIRRLASAIWAALEAFVGKSIH